MTNFNAAHRVSRGLKAVALAAFVMGHSSLVTAAAPAATVATIESTRVADLILLRGGFDAGLRAGMVCRISRGPTEIAEVLLVELRPGCSAALILNLAPKQSIRPGDTASVKVLKS